MWEVWIHNTRSGAPELPIPVSGGTWSRHLGSTGSGSHTLKLHNAGIPKSLIREISRGNKYTLAQRWGSACAYAGVLQSRPWVEGQGQLTLNHKELRAAMLGVRLPHGVHEYNPAAGALTVTERSRAAAARAVLNAATKGNQVAGWELPLDLPADAAGSFSANWLHEEGLTTEDLLAQIEADGAEVDFAPYITPAGYLRYEVRVGSPIAVGGAFPLAARAPGSIVLNLSTNDDYAEQTTGVLGFGSGTGQDRPTSWAPTDGTGIGDLPVRDVRVNFPDIYTPARLQAALDADFAQRRLPISQWSFGLYIGGLGPTFTAPGQLLDLHVYGSAFIPDGAHKQRVIALAGGMNLTVTPEVQPHG